MISSACWAFTGALQSTASLAELDLKPDPAAANLICGGQPISCFSLQVIFENVKRHNCGFATTVFQIQIMHTVDITKQQAYFVLVEFLIWPPIEFMFSKNLVLRLSVKSSNLAGCMT